jgi:hypothetical protein
MTALEKLTELSKFMLDSIHYRPCTRKLARSRIVQVQMNMGFERSTFSIHVFDHNVQLLLFRYAYTFGHSINYVCILHSATWKNCYVKLPNDNAFLLYFAQDRPSMCLCHSSYLTDLIEISTESKYKCPLLDVVVHAHAVLDGIHSTYISLRQVSMRYLMHNFLLISMYTPNFRPERTNN